MEDMTYITQSNISLKEIATCLENAGYKVFDTDFAAREALIVYYPLMHQGEIVETYCRWLDVNLETIEPAQIRRFHQKDPYLKYLFNIMYSGSGQFLPLVPVFKQVLERYGGYAYVEGQFFDKHTIEDIEFVKYGIFSEDEETDI